MNIVYFELNNWFAGRDYPFEEPFISWIDSNKLSNENWVKKNKICVVASIVDMSHNFCVTATEQWVKEICPKLLTDFSSFLRYPDSDGDVYGQFGHYFLEYEEKNFGVVWVEDDLD